MESAFANLAATKRHEAEPRPRLRQREVREVARQQPKRSLQNPLADLAGYVRVRAMSHSAPGMSHAVLLVDDTQQKVVPIFIGGTEALSIKLRLAGRQYVRPLTHDLLDKVLARLGGKLLRAQVDAIEHNVYIGTIVIDQNGKAMALDARPSDAIALAIGHRAPIYVARNLVDAVGLSRRDLEQPQRAPRHMNPVAL